jgi:UDP-N-acetylglucosamine 2-epimerase (non-hydrolysing)
MRAERKGHSGRPCIVIGTRPEIIKMAPLVHEFNRRKVPIDIVHTGQHYSYNMSQIFLKELGIRNRIEHLEVGGGSHSEVTAKAMVGLERFFGRFRPSIVLVEGDTNTVLAGGLAAAKMHVPVGHVEAGLRSYDRRMPEEHNRRLVDHLSDMLFAPTELNRKVLLDEKVQGKVFVTGNTVIDACLMNMPIAEKRSKVTRKLGLIKEAFALATVHRQENVDDKAVLRSFIKIFSDCPVPVLLPLHPRTLKMAGRFGLKRSLLHDPNIIVIEPVGYFDFLMLMRASRFILTDSGGIQEEATAPNIRKKVFVLRTSTERPEAVKAGYAELVGVKAREVLRKVHSFIEGRSRTGRGAPYGKGDARIRTVDLIVRNY